jgi:glycosyltransferase involved in cell wall biosynthesis
MAKRISYLISTRNRAKGLAQCLEAVLKVDFPDWELIVVDNGSTDATADIVRSFQERHPGRIQYVLEPRPGASRGRNAAVRASSGSILVFSDDDCYPEQDYLQRIEEAFVAEPTIAYLSGRIELFDPNDAPETIRTSMRPEYYEGHRYIGSGKVVGANMAFRRTVFETVGMFDPLLGPGTPVNGAEDQDMGIRASMSGLRGRYCPEAVVYHHHGRSISEVAKLRGSYNIGRGGMNMKLLLSTKTFWYGVLGWLSLGKRILRRQSTLHGELLGAARYLKTRRQTGIEDERLPPAPTSV